MKYKPALYQSAGIELILEEKRCALWLPMGSGKTSIVLHAISELFESNNINKVLIVAPKTVCETVWPSEITKWEKTGHLWFLQITGNTVKRTKQLTKYADIHIINYELLSWLFEQKPRYDMVVLDESYRLKDPSTARFKLLKKKLVDIPYIVELSGTPAAKGLQGLWSQFFLLDRGKALGKYYRAFLERWFLSDFMGYNWTLRPGAEKDIHKRIEHKAMSVKSSRFSWMPKVIRSNLYAYADLESYRELKRECMLKIEEDETITAVSAAVLVGKLQQWAQGQLYLDNREGNYTIVHNAKLDVLDSVVSEAVGASVLVYYYYKSDKERLQERYPKAVFHYDSKVQHQWNAGQINMLILQLTSNNEGINLQHGGNIICFYALHYNYSTMEQAVGRLARRGQTETVCVYYILLRGTVDERILKVAKNEETIQQALLEHVKYETV